MSHFRSTDCAFAHVLASSLRSASQALAERWLARIAERGNIDPESVYPVTQRHNISLIILGVADYVDNTHESGVGSRMIGKAIELGALRFHQGFDAYEIFKEYELLAGVLYAHLDTLADEALVEHRAHAAVLLCGRRLFGAVSLLQQASILHFLRLADAKKAQREEHLRAFNRSLSHEIKNQIGALVGAGDALVTIAGLEHPERDRLIDIIVRNARVMQHTVENLLALSRTDGDARQHHRLRLSVAAREAARQLRDNSQRADVEIRLAEFPDVEVNAAAVELCVTNYLSNAIKYADPKKRHRFAVISGSVEAAPNGQREVVIRVSDNGLGVPPEKRRGLFQRFYRAHDRASTRAEGTGLGLSIVSETVVSLGGRAWAEFPSTGSVFAFSLPYRRVHSTDAVA